MSARSGGDRRKVPVEVTGLGQQTTGAFYGPIASEGALLLDRFDDDEIARILHFVRAATELTDRHRARIRDLARRRLTGE